MRLWDAAAGLCQLGDRQPKVSGLAFSPDGRTLAAGRDFNGNMEGVYFYDPATGVEVGRLPDSIKGGLAVAYSPDGNLLAWWRRGAAHSGCGMWPPERCVTVGMQNRTGRVRRGRRLGLLPFPPTADRS